MTATSSMESPYLVCPLCGLEFRGDDTLCEHGCPFRSGCPLSRCPSCGYEFAERSRPGSWLAWIRSVLGNRPPTQASCERPLSILHLERGERARVSALPSLERRRNTLAVFGLTPGTELTLLQKTPAYVVKVGETELALDAEIAGEVLIERGSEPRGETV